VLHIAFVSSQPNTACDVSQVRSGMTTLELVLLILLVVAAMLPAGLVFFRDITKQWRLQDQMRRVTVYRGVNDDLFAKGLFLDLLSAAKEDLEIFDDGNKMEGSIYMDEEIVQAVKQKLESLPRFRMRCFFNDNEETLFKRKLSSNPAIDIRYASKEYRPLIEKHYKIVDGGLLVYVSKHERGGRERDYEFYNCRNVEGKYLNEVINLRFGQVLVNARAKFVQA